MVDNHDNLADQNSSAWRHIDGSGGGNLRIAQRTGASDNNPRPVDAAARWS